MRLAFVLFCLTALCACANSRPISVDVTSESETRRAPSEEVAVYDTAEEVGQAYTEIATLKVSEFKKDAPRRKIIEALTEQARLLGADGLIVGPIQGRVMIRRDTVRGGISTGDAWMVSSSAIVFE